MPLVRQGGEPVAYPFDYIEEAAAAGLLAGKPGDQGQIFSPNAPVTRGQLAQVVARMARVLKGYPDDYPAGPATFGDVPAYAAADVAFTAALGLMNGYSSARFDMWSPAQRGHLAVVMTRFLDLAPYQPPPPPSTTTTTQPTTTTTAEPTTTTTAPPTDDHDHAPARRPPHSPRPPRRRGQTGRRPTSRDDPSVPAPTVEASSRTTNFARAGGGFGDRRSSHCPPEPVPESAASTAVSA